MKIVLITGSGIEHHYVANRLSEALDLSAIVVDLGVKRSVVGRIRRLVKKYTFRQLCSKVIRRILHFLTNELKKKHSSMVRVLNPERCLAFTDEDKVVYLRGINRPENVSVINEYQPDIILIYGTGIIGKKIMSIPTKTILNMHTGISPYYRGAGCSFWPIYDEKLEYLGATVHECTPDVDGGKIYGTVQATLEEDDDLHSVFARAVLAGTDLYIRVVRQMINGEIQGVSQDFSLGNEYTSAMRTWWHEIIVKNKIKGGLIRQHVNNIKNST